MQRDKEQTTSETQEAKPRPWGHSSESFSFLLQPGLRLGLPCDTTAAHPVSQSKDKALIGLCHFNEMAPRPNKYKHRHLQLIMVLLICQISLQIAC